MGIIPPISTLLKIHLVQPPPILASYIASSYFCALYMKKSQMSQIRYANLNGICYNLYKVNLLNCNERIKSFHILCQDFVCLQEHSHNKVGKFIFTLCALTLFACKDTVTTRVRTFIFTLHCISIQIGVMLC